jgi:hypothetical protein
VKGSQCILERLSGGCGVDSVGSEQGLVVGSCQQGDEPLSLAPRSYLVITY